MMVVFFKKVRQQPPPPKGVSPFNLVHLAKNTATTIELLAHKNGVHLFLMLPCNSRKCN